MSIDPKSGSLMEEVSVKPKTQKLYSQTLARFTGWTK